MSLLSKLQFHHDLLRYCLWNDLALLQIFVHQSLDLFLGDAKADHIVLDLAQL